MAIKKTLLVEFENFWVEIKIEVDDTAKGIASEPNAVKCGAVGWIEAAIELKTEVVVMHRLQSFERDDGIFAASDRNKVTGKPWIGMGKVGYSRVARCCGLCWCGLTFNFEEFVKSEI